jgi:hypothetical protein
MTGCFLPTCPNTLPTCGQKRLRQCAVAPGRSRSAACRRGCRDRARRFLCPAALGDWGKDAAGGDLDQTRQRLEQAFRQSKSLSRPAPGKFARLATARFTTANNCWLRVIGGIQTAALSSLQFCRRVYGRVLTGEANTSCAVLQRGQADSTIGLIIPRASQQMPVFLSLHSAWTHPSAFLGAPGWAEGWARGSEGGGGPGVPGSVLLHSTLGKLFRPPRGAQSWARGWPRWAAARTPTCPTYLSGGSNGQYCLARLTRCTCTSRTMVRHFSQLARLRDRPLLAAAVLLCCQHQTLVQQVASSLLEPHCRLLQSVTALSHVSLTQPQPWLGAPGLADQVDIASQGVPACAAHRSCGR